MYIKHKKNSLYFYMKLFTIRQQEREQKKYPGNDL